MKLNCHDLSIKDNDMTDRTDVIYAKNEIELSWLIG